MKKQVFFVNAWCLRGASWRNVYDLWREPVKYHRPEPTSNSYAGSHLQGYL